MAGDRCLSLWAWGWADREPTDERLDKLAALVEGMLGFPERPRIAPADPEEVDLADPRVEPPGLGEPEVTADRRARLLHTYGKAYRDVLRNHRGVFDPAPDLVARPTDEPGVRALVDWAHEEGVAVVPFGGGTSVVAGLEADGDGYEGVVSLDLRGLDRVVDIDEEDRLARVQAGLTGPQLNAALREQGYVLRHYPQSYEFSTVGGWIATRAGGHYATERTRIDDFVQSAHLVAPAATLETARVPSSGAGPDLASFVVGSEGALGAITEARLRVEPRARHRSRATLHFEDRSDAVRAVRAVVQSGLRPANLRLLDRREAMLNRVADENVVLLGFEAPGHPVQTSLEQAVAMCRDEGGRLADDPTHRVPGEEADPGDDEDGDEAGRWRASFLDAPYLMNAMVGLAVVADTFETCVPWSRFEALDRALRDRLLACMEERCGTGFLSMRFTNVYPDGPAPYYTFLAPADPGEELDVWRELKTVASDTIREHAATITHHHAVGRTHKPWYEGETPDELRQGLRQAKAVLDPRGIMNPGALVDPL